MATSKQKQGYDRVRRERKQKYHHLYNRLPGVTDEKCYYCGKKEPDTIDHCPSLILVALMGLEYFQQEGIPFVLLPTCMKCNIRVGTSHVFIKGRLTNVDFRGIRREMRKRARK